MLKQQCFFGNNLPEGEIGKVMDIAGLYRQIGKCLREQGAERIYLLSAKYKSISREELKLELAVTGDCDKENWGKIQKEMWPFLEIETCYENEEAGEFLDRELIADSIQL